MCDLAYLLREIEQKQLETLGPTPHVRFVPFMAAQSPSLGESAVQRSFRSCGGYPTLSEA
jgi:hypothetical protein